MLAQGIDWCVKAKDNVTDQIYRSEIQCYPAKYENPTFWMNFLLRCLKYRVGKDMLSSTHPAWCTLLVSGDKVKVGKGEMG